MISIIRTLTLFTTVIGKIMRVTRTPSIWMAVNEIALVKDGMTKKMLTLKLITRRLSGIHAAWHFWFAVSFGGESGLRKLGLCGIHPL
ncbi:hypothetical protein, partial [Vibrio vulnificus]|uniref:hypothetical protein n=2 Tax=Vibrio vulnificus TaxID=672 RepID=UPI004058C38C